MKIDDILNLPNRVILQRTMTYESDAVHNQHLTRGKCYSAVRYHGIVFTITNDNGVEVQCIPNGVVFTL